ncbi:hypothetical protein EVAR_21794_1 [Eumeta japonica]|uniref:Uncharacterized protein n=1 Tax=Eumeta variegata TaxID=151549 RepID=A0A4C1YF85_EUMVA|nr:hypothetical protein EVAR_21794_1 [Eumeta japonica]
MRYTYRRSTDHAVSHSPDPGLTFDAGPERVPDFDPSGIILGSNTVLDLGITVPLSFPIPVPPPIQFCSNYITWVLDLMFKRLDGSAVERVVCKLGGGEFEPGHGRFDRPVLNLSRRVVDDGR